MIGPQGLQNARAGLFRALDREESAKFARKGSADYAEAVEAGEPFELNPVHHPRYRQGVLLAALEHVNAEIEFVQKTRYVELDRPENGS